MDDFDREDGCSAANLSAADNQELRGIIAQVVESDGGQATALFPRFSKLVVRYQEQPQLLDPVLEALVRPLAALLLRIGTPAEVLTTDADAKHRLCATCRLLWQLASVRGYKTVLRFFPNEVATIEPAAALMAVLAQSAIGGDPTAGQQTWEAQYVMLMWLSLLAMVPFDFAIIDSSLAGAAGAAQPSACPPLASNIISLCRDFLASPGPTREMAAVLVGRMVARPDMEAALEEFVEWGAAALTSPPPGAPHNPSAAFLLPGVTLAFATIFKLGKREALGPAALRVLPLAAELLHSQSAASNALVRKLAAKLVQRAGLVFLPQRRAAWRYQRGGRALNLGINGSLSADAGDAGGNEGGEEEEEDAPWAADERQAAAVESAIECMLGALSDRDTVVRWSASKGLGRLTGRLPAEMGDEVVSSVLAAFLSPVAGDSTWHGGCLAVAELTRRGLLLPSRLAEAVPLVVRALEFDLRRGHCSVGAHVRDAAAYVCWAVARAYSPQTLHEAAEQLAPALITAACFDREVNCRRAAAAAFQECVGRLGTFPYGIDILTAADYFTVSVRTTAFTSVATQVASYPGYFEPLAWHLLRIKLHHWDKALRVLTAKALADLVPLRPTFFLEHALPCLLASASSPVLETRHGAVAAVAELLTALQGSQLPPPLAVAIADLLPTIYRLKLAKGKGGEVMRGALCRLAETTCSSNLPLSKEQKECLYSLVFENLHHPEQSIQEAAAKALSAFADQHLRGSEGEEGDSVVLLLARLLRELQPGSQQSAPPRRGAALALGLLPPWALRAAPAEVLTGLAAAAAVEENPDHRDVETRVNAAGAIAQVAAAAWEPHHTLSAAESGKLKDLVLATALASLLGCLDDYSTDNRGDVGSWVREAAMHSVLTMLRMLGPAELHASGAAAEASAQRALAQLARLTVERIGRVREVAGSVLRELAPLLAEAGVPGAAQIATVVSSISSDDYASGRALKPMAGLLAVTPASRLLRESLLQGLAFTIGGLDAQFSEAASEALVDALAEEGIDLAAVGDSFTASWTAVQAQTQRKCCRMALPFLTTAELLLSRTDLQDLRPPASDFASAVLRLARGEVTGCGDVQRLHAAAAALCALAVAATSDKALREEALGAVLALVGNKYPKVRRYAAEQLYTALLGWEEGDGEEEGERDIDIALELLGDTPWDGPADLVKPARLALTQRLGLLPSCLTPEGGERGGKKHVTFSDE